MQLLRQIRPRLYRVLGLALVLTAGTAHAEWFVRGREMEEDRDFRLQLSVGSVRELDAVIQETTRKLYDVTGGYWKQATAENYDLNDLGMEDGYLSLGISLEKAWKYFSLQFDTAFFQAESDAVARRDYYIEVGDDIVYQGQTYDQIQIPEGTPFTLDMTALTLELRGLITPFTFKAGENFRFTPWIDLGLFGFGGRYDIDAGPVRGVTQYQDPPEDFTIGGRSSGYGGLGAPEWGLGGEIRVGAEERLHFVLQGHYAVCEYHGGTEAVTVNEHREKTIDLDHSNTRIRGMLDIPLRAGRCLTVGAQYQLIDSEALISSSATDPEEILAKRERFDKEVDFRLETLQGFIGLTF